MRIDRRACLGAIAVCGATLFGVALPCRAGDQRVEPAQVLAVRHVTGTFIGFTVGDYYHAGIRPEGQAPQRFFVPVGLRYFLASRKGQVVRATYHVVRTHVPEAGGKLVIEQLVDVAAGRDEFAPWWRKETSRASMQELRKRFEPLVEAATIDASRAD